jgi:hypothetical protein
MQQLELETGMVSVCTAWFGMVRKKTFDKKDVSLLGRTKGEKEALGKEEKSTFLLLLAKFQIVSQPQ